MNAKQQTLENTEFAITEGSSHGNLKLIGNIYFTTREIDIIACILGGRSSKKIASFLSISPNTVSIHIRNIMLRLGCNSRERIIDFIEKSDKFTLIKKHYANLLIKTSFELELKKISTLMPEKGINCINFYYTCKKTRQPFIIQLEKHLGLAGIKTVNKVWEKNKSKAYFANNIITPKTDCIIYSISNEFVERLKTVGCELNSEISNVKSLAKEKHTSAIFLVLDSSAFTSVQEKSLDFVYMDLAEAGNYYFLVFEILKKLLPTNSINKNIDEFKKQYRMLLEPTLPIVLKGNILETEAIKVENINHSKKTFLSKWTIFFFVIIVLKGFIFDPLKESSFVNDKLSKFTNSQNVLLQTPKKTLVFNLPPRNNKFTGRNGALVQLKKELDKQKFGVITQAISGLGGVGKTQLATEFAYQAAERSDYKVILWISAETSNAINHAYVELAKTLQIDVRGLNPGEIQGLVHHKLTKKHGDSKILFILDNAPDHDNIQDYLNELQRQLLTKFPLHILITSRSQHWPENPLILDTFTQQEALMFVKKHLPDEKARSIIKLARTLHYFPLALNQATAYIRKHTNISDYLELYSTQQKDYLDNFSGDRNQYTETLWKTWYISLNKLSNPSKEILFISSYLYSDDIPITFFDNLAVEARGDAIEELRKHSFITLTSNNNAFKIHRLLQEVIRMTLVAQAKSKTAKRKFYGLTEAINLL